MSDSPSTFQPFNCLILKPSSIIFTPEILKNSNYNSQEKSMDNSFIFIKETSLTNKIRGALGAKLKASAGHIWPTDCLLSSLSYVYNA